MDKPHGILMNPKTDHICGIDRYKDSPEYGKLISEVVLLQKRPGGTITGSNAKKVIKGAVKHGDKVAVLATRKRKGALWAKVSCDLYPTKQIGWMNVKLLKEMGVGRHTQE